MKNTLNPAISCSHFLTKFISFGAKLSISWNYQIKLLQENHKKNYQKARFLLLQFRFHHLDLDLKMSDLKLDSNFCHFIKLFIYCILPLEFNPNFRLFFNFWIFAIPEMWFKYMNSLKIGHFINSPIFQSGFSDFLKKYEIWNKKSIAEMA